MTGRGVRKPRKAAEDDDYIWLLLLLLLLGGGGGDSRSRSSSSSGGGGGQPLVCDCNGIMGQAFLTAGVVNGVDTRWVGGGGGWWVTWLIDGSDGSSTE